jgi:hypothetical protein
MEKTRFQTSVELTSPAIPFSQIFQEVENESRNSKSRHSFVITERLLSRKTSKTLLVLESEAVCLMR